MDVFLSHIWYIIATFVLGMAVGMKYKEQLVSYFSRAQNFVLNLIRK